MQRSVLSWCLVAALFLGVVIAAHATTWAEIKVVCPLCGTENKFLGIMSYGNYIYQWPSKFQFIFWPFTDEASLYHCKKCHYSAFLGEFEKPPEGKLDAIRGALAGVKLKTETDEYTRIPMSERLGIAERVYGVLDPGDNFWCHFYRVLAYHLEHEGKLVEADAARRKAIDLARKMGDAKENAGQRKESLLISGAMRHFLGEDQAALDDLRAAAALTYENPKLKPEQNKNYDEYLSKLLKEYIEAITNGKSTADPPEKP